MNSLRRRDFLWFAAAAAAVPGAVLGHALPGTMISLDVSGADVVLQATVPLEELILALPAARGIGQSLTAADEQMLLDYFARHARVLNGDDVPFNLADAGFYLIEAQNDHVGVFRALVADIRFEAPMDADVRDLRLEYDVVIHHVRNHKAGVMRKDSGTDIPAGVIAYDFALKAVPPLALAPGPEQN
jgi:hypothetical protein